MFFEHDPCWHKLTKIINRPLSNSLLTRREYISRTRRVHYPKTFCLKNSARSSQLRIMQSAVKNTRMVPRISMLSSLTLNVFIERTAGALMFLVITHILRRSRRLMTLTEFLNMSRKMETSLRRFLIAGVSLKFLQKKSFKKDLLINSFVRTHRLSLKISMVLKCGSRWWRFSLDQPSHWSRSATPGFMAPPIPERLLGSTHLSRSTYALKYLRTTTSESLYCDETM